MPAARKTRKPNNPSGKQRRLDRNSGRVKAAHSMAKLGSPQKGSNKDVYHKLIRRHP